MSFPVNFWFISGEISVEKILMENFYSTKRLVFEFQGESPEQFLSYRAHFRRYLEDLGSLLPARFVAVNMKFRVQSKF